MKVITEVTLPLSVADCELTSFDSDEIWLAIGIPVVTSASYVNAKLSSQMT